MMIRGVQRISRHGHRVQSITTSTQSIPIPPRKHVLARNVGALLGVTGLSLYLFDTWNSRIVTRSSRVFLTGGQVYLDYNLNLKSYSKNRKESKEAEEKYQIALQAFNLRTAQHLLSCCFHNGGIYTKFGQSIATMNHGLPKEYILTLAQLQDKAKSVSYEIVNQAIEQALKHPISELFQEFDKEPIAAASLAQVHHAVDLNGREVAVKIQYPHLESQVGTDMQVMKLAAKLTEWAYDGLEVMWLFPEFENAIQQELDFTHEKENARRIAKCLEHNDQVYVPKVYDELSCSKVMTMEYIHGIKINNVPKIQAAGLNTRKVAQILCHIFSDMTFCQGFVHCDPHAGNIFVRKNPNVHAKVAEQLVLLDHGLYRELDTEFRRTYCDLWKSMILRDEKLLHSCCDKLLPANSDSKLRNVLPLILTYRPFRKGAQLAGSMTEAEKLKLVEEFRDLHFSNVTDFLQLLPRDMMFVFRTTNMIRSLNKDLGGTTRDRFSIMGEYAVRGHALYHKPRTNLSAVSGSHTAIDGKIQPKNQGTTSDPFASRYRNLWRWDVWRYYVDHMNLLFHLYIVDYVLGVRQLMYGDSKSIDDLHLG